MEKASQDLMNEHKVIQNALDVIEKMSEKALKGKPPQVRDIEEITEFLTIFADKCHHGKEEEILFPALEKAGIKNQGGPIGVMLEQHRQGRELIKQMKGTIETGAVDQESFAGAASSYVVLMRNHIVKENTILFPMGDAKLTTPTQKELLEKFEHLEREVIGEGIHEKLHAKLERLEKIYI